MMTEDEGLIKKILDTIEENKMVSKGDHLLVSISGGPDSVMLLHSLHKLKDVLNTQLTAFTLDHLTRQGESTKDFLFVKKICREMGIKLIGKKMDVRQWCSKKGLSFQEGARKLRIELLLDLAQKENADKIATGHNASDSIETFFINLFRGAGPRGLKGIEPVQGKFIRPLIKLKKEEIEQYLDLKKIGYRIDKTNLEENYTRNKIRNKLLPLLRKEYSGSIDSVVLKTIDIIREEQDYLDLVVSDIFKMMISDTSTIKSGYLVIPIEKLMKLHKALKRLFLIHSIKIIHGGIKDLKKENVDSIISMTEISIERKVLYIYKDLFAIKEGSEIYLININKSHLFIERIKKVMLPKEDMSLITIDKTSLESGKLLEIVAEDSMIFIKIIDKSDLGKRFDKSADDEAFVDFDEISFPIKIRSWSEGDSFIPLGLKGHKKLSDFFNDLKIPYSIRKRVKIFEDGKKIFWIGGYRIDDRVRIGKDTSKILFLKIEEKKN